MKVFFFYSLTYIVCFSLQLFFRYYIKSWPLALIVIRIVIAAEFAFLGFFYFYNIKNHIKKPILIFSNIFFVSYSFYDFYVSKADEFSFIPVVIECLFFLFVIPYFFYEKMQYSVAKPIYQSPSFWISVAFLIYFSGNFFYFMLSRDPVLYDDPQFTILSDNIYDSLTILKNLLLCTAIFVNNSQEKHVSSPNKIPISIDLDFFKANKNKN
jgi:hypothetical protein